MCPVCPARSERGIELSSLALEDQLMSHPAVLEASVIGIADERWQERPLACVVFRPGVSATVEELRAHLDGRIAHWWVPECWAFLDAIPRTSVGKFDKRTLRAREKRGELPIETA